MEAPVPLATLTTVGDLTVARLLAARLEGEGIDTVVKGEPLGPYPVTVGRMAVTEILVPVDQIAEARSLLVEIQAEAEATEVESAGTGPSPDLRLSVLWWLVAAALLAWIIWVRILRFV